MLALAHDSAGDARANADALADTLEHGRKHPGREQWAEIFETDRTDIQVEGLVVTARLPLADPKDILYWRILIDDRPETLVAQC